MDRGTHAHEEESWLLEGTPRVGLTPFAQYSVKFLAIPLQQSYLSIFSLILTPFRTDPFVKSIMMVMEQTMLSAPVRKIDNLKLA